MSIEVSRSFKDISLSFTKHPVTNDILILKNEDAIKKSVSNIIRTSLGERFFDANLGTRINDYIFENATQDVVFTVRDDIRSALDNYEPRIKIDRIDVDITEDGNELNVQVVYDIIGLGILPQKVNFILSPT
jgi:phage baseplate assembly protein W